MQYSSLRSQDRHNTFSSMLPKQRAGADSPSPVSATEDIAKPAERCLPAFIRPSQKRTSQHILWPKSTKQSAGEKCHPIRDGRHLSKMNAQVFSSFRCRKWFLADSSTPRWRQVNYFYYAFWMVIFPQTSFWHRYCTQYIPKEMTRLLQHLERDSCLYRQSPGILPLRRETW